MLAFLPSAISLILVDSVQLIVLASYLTPLMLFNYN
jgi:hypothetical protein